MLGYIAIARAGRYFSPIFMVVYTRPAKAAALTSLPHTLHSLRYSATKAGFVEKQAFLSRVDERKFELEREERARDRSRREAEAAAAARR